MDNKIVPPSKPSLLMLRDWGKDSYYAKVYMKLDLPVELIEAQDDRKIKDHLINEYLQKKKELDVWFMEAVNNLEIYKDG